MRSILVYLQIRSGDLKSDGELATGGTGGRNLAAAERVTEIKSFLSISPEQTRYIDSGILTTHLQTVPQVIVQFNFRCPTTILAQILLHPIQRFKKMNLMK